MEGLRMKEGIRIVVLPLNAYGYGLIIVTKYFFLMSGE